MSNSDTEAIKARLNLVEIARRYMTLQRKGGRWHGLCPFHQEKTPSFSINEEEGLFYCFGCQASGDLFDFYARINGLEFKEALEQLAEEAGVRLERKRRESAAGQGRGAGERDIRKQALKIYDLATSHYRANLRGNNGAVCRNYIAERKIAPEIVDAFELGFSLPDWGDLAKALRRAGFTPEEGVSSGILLPSAKGGAYDRFRARFMFPIKNQAGQTIAFGGRIIPGLDDRPEGAANEGKAAKYVNSADSPLYKKGDNVYGLFQARRSISAEKSVILTEGYMDVLTLHQFGFTNSCGVLGTALTPEQVRRLAGFCSDFELIFDADGAGRKAALRSAEMLLARGLRCRVVLLPEGEDIDSLLHGQGRAAFEALRKNAPEGLDFCVSTLQNSFAPKDALDWVKNFLRNLEAPEFMPRFLTPLCRGLGLDEQELRRTLQKAGAKSGKGRAGMYGEDPGPEDDPFWGLEEADLEGAYPDAGLAPEDYGPAQMASGLGSDLQKVRISLTMEREILNFLTRYPRHAPVLRNAGLEFLLTHPAALELWGKILAAGPEFQAESILRNLNEREKAFWVRCRGMEAPPAERESIELEDICKRIDVIYKDKTTKACVQTLRRGVETDGAALLKAIMEAKRAQEAAEKK